MVMSSFRNLLTQKKISQSFTLAEIWNKRTNRVVLEQFCKPPPLTDSNSSTCSNAQLPSKQPSIGNAMPKKRSRQNPRRQCLPLLGLPFVDLSGMEAFEKNSQGPSRSTEQSARLLPVVEITRRNPVGTQSSGSSETRIVETSSNLTAPKVCKEPWPIRLYLCPTDSRRPILRSNASPRMHGYSVQLKYWDISKAPLISRSNLHRSK